MTSVLGLLNYRGYVPNYSRLLVPLTRIMDKQVPNTLPWNSDAQVAFHSAEKALGSVIKMTALEPRKNFLGSRNLSNPESNDMVECFQCQLKSSSLGKQRAQLHRSATTRPSGYSNKVEIQPWVQRCRAGLQKHNVTAWQIFYKLWR